MNNNELLEAIKKLRELTGVGIGDCRKALIESNNNIDEAILALRKKGEKISNSLQDKETNEGNVFICISNDKKSAALLSLCCQTDFVARMDSFMLLGQKIANLAVEKQTSTKEDLLNAKFSDNETVAEAITKESGVSKEKIEITNFGFLSGEHVGNYLHYNKQVGAIALFDKINKEDEEIARMMALHIAVSAPKVVAKEDLDKEFVAREFELAKEKAAASGKPANVAEKIAQGMVDKSLSEVVLMSQQSTVLLEDGTISVEEFLKKNPNVKIKKFCRISIK